MSWRGRSAYQIWAQSSQIRQTWAAPLQEVHQRLYRFLRRYHHHQNDSELAEDRLPKRMLNQVRRTFDRCLGPFKRLFQKQKKKMTDVDVDVVMHSSFNWFNFSCPVNSIIKSVRTSDIFKFEVDKGLRTQFWLCFQLHSSSDKVLVSSGNLHRLQSRILATNPTYGAHLPYNLHQYLFGRCSPCFCWSIENLEFSLEFMPGWVCWKLRCNDCIWCDWQILVVCLRTLENIQHWIIELNRYVWFTRRKS